MKSYVFLAFLFLFGVFFWEDYGRHDWDRELRHNFVLSRGFDVDSGCEYD